MSSSANKRKSKSSKDLFEKFAPPDIENLTYDENFVINSSMKNNYETICGALDAKDHPLALYIIEKNLFNKRDDYGKSPFDLAALLENKDFIRTLIDRYGDKLDDTAFDLRKLLRPNNPYNFMHYACIWGRLDLCKFLAEHPKLILDPSNDSANDSITGSAANIQNVKANIDKFKTLGSVLLKAKAKTGETPIEIAKRYNHVALVEYLTYAEKRQYLIDRLNEIKSIAADPEKNQNKIAKDDKFSIDVILYLIVKEKVEKVVSDSLEWIEQNKYVNDLKIVEEKINEIEEQVKPIFEKMYAKINESNSNTNLVSSRSKTQSPSK